MWFKSSNWITDYSRIQGNAFARVAESRPSGLHHLALHSPKGGDQEYFFSPNLAQQLPTSVHDTPAGSYPSEGPQPSKWPVGSHKFRFKNPSKVLFYYLSVILCITGVISLGKCAWIPVIGILSSVRNNLEDPLDLTDLLNLVFKILKRRISAKPNILLPARGADATASAWLQLPLCRILLPPHC